MTASLTNPTTDLHVASTMTGKISPGVRGVRVLLQSRTPEGAWQTVQKKKTKNHGKLKFDIDTATAGQVQYRVKASGNRRHKGGVSSASTQTVYRWLYVTQVGEALDDDADQGAANIAGVTYTQSFWATDCNTCDSQDDGWQLVTSARCSTFAATIGMQDKAGTTQHPVVTVLEDGQQVYSTQLSFGKAVPLQLDISRVLQFSVTMVGDGYATLGNGRVRCYF